MFQFSLNNLLSQKIRSLLSIIAISIAVFGVICIFSFSRGIKTTVHSALNLIEGVVVMEKGTPDPKLSTISTSYKKKISRNKHVKNVIPWIWALATSVENSNMISRGMMNQEAIGGVDLQALSRTPNQHIYPKSLIKGRFLQPGDRQHVVLSQLLADRYEKSIGDTISIRGHSFEVIGLYKTGNKFLDVTHVIPKQMARQLKGMDASTVSDLYVVPREGVSKPELKRSLEQQLFPYQLTPSSQYVRLHANSRSSRTPGTISFVNIRTLSDVREIDAVHPRILVARQSSRSSSRKPVRKTENAPQWFMGIAFESPLVQSPYIEAMNEQSSSPSSSGKSIYLTDQSADRLEKTIGDTLTIQNHHFTVNGIYTPSRPHEDYLGGFMSLETARTLSDLSSSQIHDALIIPRKKGSPKTLLSLIRQHMLEVDIRSSQDWKTEATSILEEINLMLLLISSLAVIVGTVGIVNTMLMSVTERTSEFGILIANGWSTTNLLTLLLYESMMLGITGGLTGIALGWSTVELIPAVLELTVEPEMSWTLLASCFSLSVIIGVLGGLYPAYRAASMDPIEAIQSIR